MIDFRALQCAQTANLIHRQEGQQSQTFFNVLIPDISPVLIEFVGRGFFGVKPNGTGNGFAHFYAFAVCQQLEGHAVSGLLCFAASQLYACDDIRPLVVAAHFQHTVVSFIQFVEIVALHNHIVKFKEGQTKLSIHTGFEAICRKHTVYGEMGTDFTQEFDIVQISQPVCVIGNDGTALALIEIDETGKLLFDAGYVMVDGFDSHHFTHIGFAGGVADHACAAAHQADGAVAAALHVRHSHNGQEMPNVQAVRGGVDADIEGDTAFFKKRLDFLFMRQLFDKAAFL